MKRIGSGAGVLALLAVVLTGSLGSAQAGPRAGIWAGTWQMGTSNWGSAWVLLQSGSSVTGTYDFCGGKIKATATGNTLKGTWSQTFPCGGAQQGNGVFEVTMSADGNSFSGHWRYASVGGWRENDPIGTRIGPSPTTTRWTRWPAASKR